MKSTQQVRHRTVQVDAMQLFYREAGSSDAPPLLLLHGSPSSSIQFRHLLPMLADRWHAIAPDLPGFGLSEAPDRSRYRYTFESLTDTIEHFLEALGVTPGALYLHDYGAQVGFRLLTRGAVRPSALIIQNSEAYYSEGRTEAWNTAEAYWRDPSNENRDKKRAAALSESGVRQEFLEELPADITELIDPAIIRLAADHMGRPGTAEAMLDLQYDYRSNVEHYAKVQNYFRESQPRALILWGRDDQYYTSAAAYAYRQHLPAAEVHVCDGGHWIIESHGAIVATLARDFLAANGGATA
jgi:pimeloyl-ACP methyl ester carboxylesterase